MRNYPEHFGYCFSYTADINDFYKNLKNTNFNELNQEKLEELKNNANNLPKLLKNPQLPSTKIGKYVKIMNSIKTNPKGFGVNNEAEKFIFFMFSVDPTFEAVKIYGESNKTDKVKEKMEKYFGVFDKRLIIVEKFFVKNFLSEKKRNEINEEIDKRAFK